MADWTTPTDLRKQLLRNWERGDVLRAWLNNENIFPMDLRLRRPTSKELATQFDEVRQWIDELSAHGSYKIQWKEIRHPLHGRNRLPQSIQISDQATALKLIGKGREAALFKTLSHETLQDYPELQPWLSKRPFKLLHHAPHWRQIALVLGYFKVHPKTGLYLRQLDISGVDTKFIEQHRGILSELLDLILPESAINQQAKGVKGFNRRYGLREDPLLIRFRLLDPGQTLHGLTDISVPPDQFAKLDPAIATIFITENKINGLAFPQLADSLVIFGLGYGLDRLKEIGWMKHKKIYYWGDIDTHGFRMLNQLRKDFPQARSLLMDRKTLDQHHALWVKEQPNQRSLIGLSRLTSEERQLYDDLRCDRIEPAVRLEQERIRFDWVNAALKEIV